MIATIPLFSKLLIISIKGIKIVRVQGVEECLFLNKNGMPLGNAQKLTECITFSGSCYFMLFYR